MQDCLAKPVVIPELIARTLHWLAAARARMRAAERLQRSV